MIPMLEREKKHLFDRGEGGRHDWMRFHANDVKCPGKTKMSEEVTLPCTGILRWKAKGSLLRCDTCELLFDVRISSQLAPGVAGRTEP